MNVSTQVDRKSIRDLVLKIHYDYQERFVVRKDVIEHVSKNTGIESDVVDSAFKILIEAGCLKTFNAAGDAEITHLGAEKFEDSISSKKSVDPSMNISTYIEKQIMGDNIMNGDNSTIVNRSSIDNSFNVDDNSDVGSIVKEFAARVDTILKELENRNPNATEQQQINYVDAIIEPDLKQKLLGGFSGGIGVYIEEFVIDNPVYKWHKVFKAVLNGWQNQSST
jgi:hypothetical protein